MKEPTKLFQFNLSARTINYLDSIQDKYGISTRTDTLRMVIANQHSKEFPEYIQVAKNRPSPVDREIAKLDAQEAKGEVKKKRENDHQREICLIMDNASITTHPENGNPACRYPIYTTKSPHTVDITWFTEELSVINDETPNLQYRGLFGEKGEEGKRKVHEVMEKMAKRGAPLDEKDPLSQ
jgi:hypothetical protein